MKKQNPFPGMNPLMELSWPDVHVALIGYIRDMLGEELPDDLRAKGESDVYVISEGERKYRPDVVVIDDSWKQGIPPKWQPSTKHKGIAATEPTVLIAEVEPHRWVEVRTDSGELVTVIEVISPANKFSQRKAYEEKRASLIDAGVNFVEIDLLRGGDRLVNVQGTHYESLFMGLGPQHYTSCVTRAASPERREVYATSLRECLPTIRVPLRTTDADLALPLQDLINRCYTSGRYWKMDQSLDQLRPPLPEEDRAWAMGCGASAIEG